MARKLRVQYPGAIYDLPSSFAYGYGGTGVMNRSDRREAIFRDDKDRLRFLEILAEACGKTGWQVHAWSRLNDVQARNVPEFAGVKRGHGPTPT